MNHLSSIALLIALALGASVAVVTWLLGRAVSDVPEQDRTYLDPPPLGIRLVWWPIQWIAHYFGGLLPARTHSSMGIRLRKAGLDYCLSPEQFFAAQVVSALLFAILAWWLMDTVGLALGWPVPGAMAFGFLFPVVWVSDRIQARRKDLLKTLPFYLDMTTLCVEAGLNVQGAMQQAVLKGPPGVLRAEFQRVLRDIRAGKQRADALRGFADRMQESSITNLVASMIQAESLGMSLGPVLRAQSDQKRTERFLRAEKLAMEAPVKMLFPMLVFIFPCTFIVIAFPIVMKLLQTGL